MNRKLKKLFNVIMRLFQEMAPSHGGTCASGPGAGAGAGGRPGRPAAAAHALRCVSHGVSAKAALASASIYCIPRSEAIKRNPFSSIGS